VKLLEEKRQEPFRQIAERLDAVGCLRRRLRPGAPLFSKVGKEDAAVRDAARAFSERLGGACRTAFAELMGLD
jgi:hypothetical protein